MASIRKKGAGYEAMVARKGIRKSGTFRTKTEARMWAAEVERYILRGDHARVADKSFADLMQRYGDIVSPGKRGARWELMRIGVVCRDPIADVRLEDLSSTHFAEWRDRRLETVSVATVLRDWNLISHALNVAVNEWEWLPENPIKRVKRPKPPAHRERRISQDEIDRLLFALGYDYAEKPETITARVGAAMLFAIETAMRAGEIVSLAWINVDLDKRVARLPITKNGLPRDVPLSAESVRVIEQVRSDSELVFDLKTSQIDSLFRKAKKRAIIDDLHFHDTRAEAITRLAKKVDILTLARISGHRDLRQLQIYYRESMEDIAKRI
jgi:integrase